MTIAQTILLSIVEGVTEYLPISSTAHLIMTSTLLHIQQTAQTTLFEVVIQTGAIFAVVILYWKTLTTHTEQYLKILASFIPTALIGLLLHSTIKTVFFQSPHLIAGSLVVVGVIFMIVEKYIADGSLKLSKHMSDITLTHALIIGTMQGMAVIPGVSRAGAVMIGMMLLGYKRTDSALYSFILAIPTLAAASALDLIKTDPALLTQNMVTSLLIGSVLSCLTALVCMKWLIAYLQRNSLTVFGIYRIVIGVLFYILT